MKENIKKILDSYFISKSQDIPEKDDPDGLYLEILEDSVIKSKNIRSHRWYDDVENISEVGDKFIKWYGYYTTGDNYWNDMDIEIDFDKMIEVVPYEKPVVKIKYKEA